MKIPILMSEQDSINGLTLRGNEDDFPHPPPSEGPSPKQAVSQLPREKAHVKMYVLKNKEYP